MTNSVLDELLRDDCLVFGEPHDWFDRRNTRLRKLFLKAAFAVFTVQLLIVVILILVVVLARVILVPHKFALRWLLLCPVVVVKVRLDLAYFNAHHFVSIPNSGHS
jgi:hypothetical protein